jgi:threonine/homoserine/homoserine lactone efflux protein
MQQAQAIIYGLGAGLLMSILLGAIFFLLINQSLKNGYKSAFPIALGVITIDAIFVILAILFTSQITSFLESYSSHINGIGGLVLIGFGIVQFVQEYKKEKNTIEKGSLYMTALSINLTNPANAAWWLSLYSIAPMSTYTLDSKVIFGVGAILGIFFTEVAIAYAAHFLKTFLSIAMIERVNKVVGIAFIFLGLRLCFSFIF